MEQYDITGMSCAACSARVEKAVKNVSGVQSCSVSLLTNSMCVEGSADENDIINAVNKAGYGASIRGAKASAASLNPDSIEHRGSTLFKRFVFSLFFLLILMYFSMGCTMWEWPAPALLKENCVAMGLLQLILTATVMVINQHFFINGFKGLVKLAPNMDTLVALGSSAAFIYSTYSVFAMSQAVHIGDTTVAMNYLHELYFESAAMILTLVTLGKMLEARSKGKTTDAIKSLIKLAPKTATVIKNGNRVLVPIEQLKVDDEFIVFAGSSVPVDGVVIDGAGAVDESALTGESIPVDKRVGDVVSAATINQSGILICKATRVGEDTTLSQIIKMVTDASASKAPVAKAADKISGVFVPIVMGIAVITAIIWLLLDQSVGFALARGISVLVISCPCALGIATPVAIMVGNGVGAKQGILFKNAVSLEQTGKINIAVLDKTGTITEGKPRVINIFATDDETELISVAGSIEYNSTHPIAKAINDFVIENGIEVETVNEFKITDSGGVSAVLNDYHIYAGNWNFISNYALIDDEKSHALIQAAEDFSKEGKTSVFFAKDKKLLGVITVADVIKEDSRQAINELKNMGIHVVMLTGDNKQTAAVMAESSGVDEFAAEVMPADKERIIKSLMKHGKVAMVGDGINDAPALTRADVGIAIGAGTDVAIDSADIVVVKSRLSDVVTAIKLSKAIMRNIYENLFWAFFYNAVGIPLAAGAFIGLLGWQLNPMFGAAAMSLSSVCVVSNALRLNLFKVKKSKVKNKPKKTLLEKERIMVKTMKIDGMMCLHCEARVKKTLEELDCVESAEVSYENGTAVITLSDSMDLNILKSAIEVQGYNVLLIE